MSQVTKYDDVLLSILVNEKSILGFLSTIFGFLARRTDFYYVPEGPYENVGFPPGVAKELVVKILKSCDPNKKAPNGARKPTDVNNEIMCSTVANEVEVIAEGDEIYEDYEATSDHQYAAPPTNLQAPVTDTTQSIPTKSNIPTKPNDTQDSPTEHKEAAAKESPQDTPGDHKPPVIPTQKNSETYNGAEREKYSWSQTIMDLDVTMRLPSDIKSSKDLRVVINSSDIFVARRNGEIILKDSLPWKIKALDCFWSLSEGKLLMHLEKVQERWWNKFLNDEDAIDLDKIDCSRPLDELPQDHIDKVRELQWNQERKLKGLPTSDEMRNIEILKKAWNAPGSPFLGQEFDPSVIIKNPPHCTGQ